MGATKYFVCPKCEEYQGLEDQVRERTEWSSASVPDPVYADFDDPVDCNNCGSIFEEDDLEIKQDPSWRDIVEQFKEDVLPAIRRQYEEDGVPDWTARREGWNNWTDMLCKAGIISVHAYENWDHPPECG